MHFPWSREHHRQELLAAPFPEPWRAYLTANVRFYASLTSLERMKLERDLRLLVAEKHWEGHGGLTITEEMQVTISAQASLLILSRDIDDFAHVESILVYPPGRCRHGNNAGRGRYCRPMGRGRTLLGRCAGRGTAPNGRPQRRIS
jgi:Mlc titration factor MtfA (ptsG expression regulator)